MTAFTMTALNASNILGAGRKDINCTYAGPTAYERNNNGSILSLASKPAAALPVSDAALTSPMLQTIVHKLDFHIPAAIEELYRFRYVPGAASAPGLGRVKVFTPPVTVVEETIGFADVAALGAFAGPLPVAAGATTLVCPLEHFIVGAQLIVDTAFVAPAATDLYIDICNATTDVGVLDSTAATYNCMTPANVGAIYTGVGPVSSETVYGDGTAQVLYPAAGCVIDCTSVGGNLGTFTAGSARVRILCVNRQAFEDVDGWEEVKEGIDLSPTGLNLSFGVAASGT